MIDAGSSYTEEELSKLTVAQLKELSEANGYTLKATKKADIIAEILSQQ